MIIQPNRRGWHDQRPPPLASVAWSKAAIRVFRGEGGTVKCCQLVGRAWPPNGVALDHCQAAIITDWPLTLPPSGFLGSCFIYVSHCS